ncbi:MAG: hypothetical protein IT168_21760 [Bryobacterales bacterium]|nr:hypothetical protein [Bryobacterales bacterium]
MATTANLLDEQLDRLAAFEPTTLPVLSLYLNTQADQHGRDNYDPFLRKEFARVLNSYPKGSEARKSIEADTARIREWLTANIDRSANGVAIFTCSAKDNFFEAVQLDAPIEEHKLYIYHQPHLYTLARLLDQFPRYVAVVADTHAARIYVFGMRGVENQQTIDNPKTKRVQAGGWSQARYQRRVDNFNAQHVKELNEHLERIVTQEKIGKIVIGGDEVLIPLLREQLSPRLGEMIVDILPLDIRTPEHQLLEETLTAIRAQDAQTDIDKVTRMLDAWRARGLAITGLHATMRALANGQVEELFISTSIEQEHDEPEPIDPALVPQLAELEGVADGNKRPKVLLADEIVTRARQTGAQVTFVEDPALLADVGGIGATLRFKL